MPFTEFCCRSGGSNLNAGTRTGSSTEPGTAADLTYASGNWVAGTGVFTVASGDPVADGVAVGDFVSVYADGSTVTGFVGRVTARTTTTITVSLSAKAGTAPADGTGNRTLKVGGAWQGPNGTSGFPFTFVASTLTNASSELPRINAKNDATYSITASVAPTTANNGITIQGYTTSYGDFGKAIIDGGTSGASYNLFSPATNKLTVLDFIFQNNGATGSAHAVSSTANIIFQRCVANSVRGIGFFGGRCVECEAYACNQSNTSGYGGYYSVSYAERCISHDNTGSNSNGFSVSPFMVNCIAESNGRNGFDISTSGHLLNCDAYNNTSDGINISGSSTEVSIANCNLVKNGGYGINGAASSPAGTVSNCGFGAGTQANTSGQTNGLGTMSVSGSVTYPNDVTPWVDPANGDFRINLADAKGAGRGAFTQTAASYTGTVGYPDIGAAQHQDSGSGGGGAYPVIGNAGLIIRGAAI